MRRQKAVGDVLTYAFLALMCAVCVLPLFWMVRSSLMLPKQIFVLPPIWIPNPVVFDNYSRAMSVAPFGQFFRNTLFIAALALVGALTTSSAAAYAFSRLRWRGRDLMFALIISSMMLPSVVTLIPTFIGWNYAKAIDTYLPLVSPSFLGGGAYNIFLLRQFYQTIPREMDEAATIDGAGYLRILVNILLPLTRPALVVVGLFQFMFNWNDFMGPLVYINSERKFTLSLGLMMFKGVYSAQWQLIMAASTIVVVPVLAVFLVGQRYFIEGIALTGIKG